MEFETMVTKVAKEYCDKTFGNKDPELKKIVEMELTIDLEDADDLAKREQFVNKLKKENTLIAESLKERNIYVHDSEGNLVPYKLS